MSATDIKAARARMRKAQRDLRQAMDGIREAGGNPFPPGPALGNAHLARCRVTATREEILDHLPKGGTALEIGTYQGRFAREILKRNEPGTLHVVDKDMSRFLHEEMAGKIADGRIVLHESLSTDYLETVPDGTFDFIYVDGAHAFDVVTEDARLSSRKLKPGGVLGFNDYIMWSHTGGHAYGVVQAVNRLCVEKGWELRFFALRPSMFCDVFITRIGDDVTLGT